MALTELLPHVARALQIDWDEATRYAGLPLNRRRRRRSCQLSRPSELQATEPGRQ